MIRVEILEDAQADLNEVFFYEAQESGLGDYFIACLRADIEGLKVLRGTHRVVYADYPAAQQGLSLRRLLHNGGRECRGVGGARSQTRPGMDTRTITTVRSNKRREGFGGLLSPIHAT